jgi:hypothetical protein
MTRSRPPKTGALVAVFLLEPAWRPVVLRSIATARTVERGDVLQRHENVSVQLDVRNVLDVAVGGQDTFLIFAAEQGDLDLLALVFVRVVLQGASGLRLPIRLNHAGVPPVDKSA